MEWRQTLDFIYGSGRFPQDSHLGCGGFTFLNGPDGDLTGFLCALRNLGYGSGHLLGGRDNIGKIIRACFER